MNKGKCALCGRSSEEMYVLSINGRIISDVYFICENCRIHIDNAISNIRMMNAHKISNTDTGDTK